MKITLSTLIKIILIYSFMQIKTNSDAQKIINIDKVDAIINLTRFMDWYPDYSNPSSKKLIIILSEENSSINYEIQSKNNFKYKNWQILCSNKYDHVNNGTIVFITNEQKSKTNIIIKISKVKNILTIADDIDDFCKNGGMINIKKQHGKYIFEINYKEIQNQNIEISSKLLALAKIL